jgi:hypothetical protein
MITLPALTYQQVIIPDEYGVVYVINPFDANGNLLSEMTFEVFNDFERVGTFLLPTISDLNNNFNIQIKFIANVNNGGTFNVFPQSGNTLGARNAIGYDVTGGNNVFTPISDNIWSVPQTIQ